MWIRTQDKKTLVDIEKFYISKVFKIISVVGETDNSNSLSITLGEYESIERATKELDSIQNFISEHPNKVYEMK